MIRHDSPEMDNHFMSLLTKVKNGSKCRRTKVAALLVNPSGYIVASVNGSDLCSSKECCRAEAERGCDLDHCRGLHAEARCIMSADKSQLKDATLYTTLAPCTACARMIIEARIKRVVYLAPYKDQEFSFRLFKESGIVTKQMILKEE